MYKIFISFFMILIFFYGCSAYDNTDRTPSVEGNITDKASWYDDEPMHVLEMQVTIPEPNEYLCSPYNNVLAPLRPCRLEDINHDVNPIDNYKPKLHVHMQIENFEKNTSLNNASFKIKGGYTRTSAQKSYSIKLDSKNNLYLGQRKIMLTKSQSDRSRLRNKVAFEIFKDIPNITSLKVSFIHVMINDQDYGLFNQPETIGKEYLIHRGYNKKDRIYNANNFLFENFDEMKINTKGEPANPEEFEKILEIKNGKDHRSLQKMLKAVNSNQDINKVIDKYFDRNNYLTWLAVNLILNNKDTIQHNFYLYNPIFTDKFYFLPWDYDGAWASTKYLSRTEYGISVWWDSILHRKFLSVEKNRNDLYALADEIRAKYITNEKVAQIINKYKDIVLPYQLVAPDSEHNSLKVWEEATNRLITRIQESIDMYKSAIGVPMPFLGMVDYDIQKNDLKISWDESIL